jgi:hypothetical protein
MDGSNETLVEALAEARALARRDMATIWVHRPDGGGHSDNEGCWCEPYAIRWDDPRSVEKIARELETRWKPN